MKDAENDASSPISSTIIIGIQRYDSELKLAIHVRQPSVCTSTILNRIKFRRMLITLVTVSCFVYVFLLYDQCRYVRIDHIRILGIGLELACNGG